MHPEGNDPSYPAFQAGANPSQLQMQKLERVPEIESGPYRWQRHVLTVKHHTRTFGPWDRI